MTMTAPDGCVLAVHPRQMAAHPGTWPWCTPTRSWSPPLVPTG